MDVVVTVPKSFGWHNWIAEGDAAGESYTGETWHFYTGGGVPRNIQIGERVYIVFNGKLRGYAPLVTIESYANGRIAFVRQGGAVAVTVSEFIQGFRGWRYRWWKRADEVSYPDWKIP